MYGLVNKAIKDLVTQRFGEDKWLEICKLSDFNQGEFIAMNTYPDALTYTLVKNASQVLKADADVILEAFGEYWILYTADEGYNELMNITGNTFVEFLENLDMLHYRMNNIMPQLAAPQFTVRNKMENSVELEYRSHREGLTPMLFGLLKGLGKRFELEVTVELIQKKDESNDCHVFLINW
jgi:hypothetical protein